MSFIAEFLIGFTLSHRSKSSLEFLWEEMASIESIVGTKARSADNILCATKIEPEVQL